MTDKRSDFDKLADDVSLDTLKGVAGGRNKSQVGGIDEEDSASISGSAGEAHVSSSVGLIRI